MNKVLNLFDNEEAMKILTAGVLPHYPDCEKIVSLQIRPYKKLIWETTYHVVISYRLQLQKRGGGEKRIEVVCSAHSNEEREVVHKVLSFLWNSGLSAGEFSLPRPLFYSKEYNGSFYRAISGDNLLKFIKRNDRDEVVRLVSATARLLAKLHVLPLSGSDGYFNLINQHIESVVPGKRLIVEEVKARFGNKYYGELDYLYSIFIAAEESFFSSTEQRWLIHGDAHPENFIAVGPEKLGVIDFTDFCPADFARDLGAFMQQLAYKIVRNLGDHSFAVEMKNLFLSSYLSASGIALDASLQDRIDLYYNWTAVRTATFWLLKHDCEPDKAEAALLAVADNLNNHRHAQD